MKNAASSSSSSPNIEDSSTPPPQSDDVVIPAAVPAATPVDWGRNVLNLHNDDDDGVASENNSINNANNDKIDSNNRGPPDSPRSFNSDEIFEDIVDVEEQVTDQDLERLLGPLPLRRTSNNNKHSALEIDDPNNNHNNDENNRRKRSKKGGICKCCPGFVRRGPLQLLFGGQAQSTPRVGNMIIIFPGCYYNNGFGIMGPHWFGPICCVALLTIATTYFAPKAYHNIGPISSITCIVFYVVALVSLFIVSCSDPGVVRSGGGLDNGATGGGNKNGYAGVPTSVSAGRGWRYCDLCSVYQPPGAVHCPECNVCIEGYDHHCPWMGTCIGKKNFTPFLAFNITWLFYLLYAIIWVTFFGLALAEGPVADSSDD